MKKIILTLVIFLFFFSCGSRKAHKERNFEVAKAESTVIDKTKTNAELNVKQEVVSIIDDKGETVTETVIYTPIDANKPASIVDSEGKKQSLNNSSYRKERTVRKNNTVTTENSKNEVTDKSEILKDLKELKKDYNSKDSEKILIERQQWSLWNLLWLLIPIGLITIFFKYKGKLWWL